MFRSYKFETCRIIFNKSVLIDFNVTWKQVHELVQVKLCDTKCTMKQWNLIFCHLRHDFSSDFFLSGFPTEALYAFIFCLLRPRFPLSMVWLS